VTPTSRPSDDELNAPTLETIDTQKVREMSAAGNVASRRYRGVAIAIALLAILVIAATVFAIRTMKKVQPEATPTAPTATP
jgi:hypothetical protein